MAYPQPAAGKTHNLVIRSGAPGATTDTGLMLPDGNLRLFTMQAYVPFAPASRQGEATNRDFSASNIWELHNDFSGGVGHLYEQITQTGDYAFAQGADLSGATTLGATLFTNKRKALLPPAKETGAGSIATFKQFIEFSGGWYAVTNATPGVVYKFAADGNSAAVVETLTAACTQLYTDGTTLYASQGASNVARTTTDGSTWANAAYNSNFHTTRDEGALSYIYGSTLVPGTGYADTVSIGETSTTVNNMVYFKTSLFIGKPEGLYKWQYGRLSTVFPVYDQRNASNFKHMAVSRGMLYFNVQNSLYATNGEGKFINLYPDDTNGFQEINGLFATFNPLLISAKMKCDAARSRNYLFMFDGVEHPGLNPLWSDADGTKTIVGCGATNLFDTSKIRIYFSQTTTGEKWLDFNTSYEPNTYHVKATTQSYIDDIPFLAGFRAIPKWDYEVILNVRNPVATTFAQVWYSVDGGTWTQTIDKDGNAHTLTLSAVSVGTYLPLNTTGTQIQLRYYLWTTSDASAAEISGVTLRGLTQVKPRYQIAFPVDCGKQVARLQGGDIDSGEAIRAAIYTAAQQGYPSKLQDPYGNWHLVAFRPPSPQESIQAYETPTGNAPERMFPVISCVLMELDALDSSGNLLAWSAG